VGAEERRYLKTVDSGLTDQTVEGDA
jgi:hypothetical protein